MSTDFDRRPWRWFRLAPLLASLCLLAAATLDAAAQRRAVTDGAGRTVEVPARITRVLAAGPPASVLLYTLAPDLMAGWVHAPSPEEKAYLAAPYRDMPAHGRLTGRGNTASIEAILAQKPDLILDVGGTDATYVSLADRVQQQTGIPYLLLDGLFARTATTYRTLGRILGREDRAETLARYAETTMQDMRRRIDAVPAARHPGVYYGRGPRGLETGLAGSINMEVLEAIGARNVAAAAGRGGLTTVSPEQILAWNPDVILALEPQFYRDVAQNPLWSGIKAVRDRRIYRVPSLPYGWFDSPPGVNRLIAIQWLAAVLYPEIGAPSLRPATRAFYDQFYHVQLTDDLLDALLRDATPPP
ncbi:iron ABC transporter substrate-binding protein [Vineibacter terrae]|uniref:Iron ABC transporter substrate-binding protein n=1 Tax=Vineibacter terrae TaxID=2586908 RepID=A0A5C8PHJ6_9HYPH|nr:iron ABC transporter substrate-binding protein [Vineibacter terrae]TXL73312.1 iron ABC transporter substrate-binding protein [Vineibacter terrae]